jgi:putative Ca2+/H+ antiporter (TMEM165/GDT1 family)
MTAFLTAFTMVVLAEMGDKTQLLAMAFATRYDWKTVMAAVFAATVINHALAIVVGVYLNSIIPTHIIQIVASVAFIIFGLWTLRGDKLEGEDEKHRFNPFWTVAIAFFIAEMGDKTQLATITIAAQFGEIIPILLGTTLGMVIADGFGIIVGMVLHKHIPDKQIKIFAAAIFILCGIAGLLVSTGIVTL